MERLRRTMIFVSGANAAILRDALLYGADSITFDLKDAASLEGKDSAHALVHSVLKTFDCDNIEIVVRINALDIGGAEDIEAMVLAGVDVIRLPKTEITQDITDVGAVIAEVEQQDDTPVGTMKMVAAIESAEGVLNASAIAKSPTRSVDIALNTEDYVTNTKTRRHPDGQKLFFARSMILHTVRVAGAAAINTVYSDIDNTEGFEAEARLIKQLGFDGKLVISPHQIPLVNTTYAPTEKEIQNAKEIAWGIRETEVRGSGVISVNEEVVDKLIVERAEWVIALTLAAKLITEEEI